MEPDSTITYPELLERLQGTENHLLIANGFNYGLGVSTGYGEIFSKMIENNSVYKDAQSMFESSNCDLEHFIGVMKSKISNDDVFLQKYVGNKIKMDFMQATHEIVKSKIKHIYAEKNEGVFMLLQNFATYFTLNYDPVLYMLLLKFSPSNEDVKNTVVFQPTLKFIEDDLDKQHDDIYTEIKNARELGKLTITVEDNIINKNFKDLKKTAFVNAISDYSQSNNKGWKKVDIEKVVTRILKEEQDNKVLSGIDDGSRGRGQYSLFSDDMDLTFKYPETQNLFFLHGAFHICRDGDVHRKITQKTDQALYDRLEDILNNDSQDIVCVFQSTDKIDVINNDEYLNHCLTKLGLLSGNLVILGSSLDENDRHIFAKINSSSVETIYISSIAKELETNYERAKAIFSSKNIIMFDANTITYELPNEQELSD